MRKPTFWFPIWSDTNQAVQLQKMARGLKFWLKKVVGLYYLCSENKGAAAKLICVYVYAYAKCWFSHDAAHILRVYACFQILLYIIVCEPHQEKTSFLHMPLKLHIK